MVIDVTLCPFCHLGENVLRHGTTKSGSARCRCLACNKTFPPRPKSRKIDSRTEEAIAQRLEQPAPEHQPLKRDSLELDELCISKKNNLWLWTALSRYSRQIPGFVIGDRLSGLAAIANSLKISKMPTFILLSPGGDTWKLQNLKQIEDFIP